MKHLVFLMILLSCLSCFSQEIPKPRTCRILFLERPVDAPQQAYLFDGAISHKVTLSSKNFSPVIELPPGKLTLGLTPEEVLTSEKFPKGAPMIAVPEKTSDLYILVTSDPDNQILPVKLAAINIDKKVSPGETLWINLTKHKILAKLGNQTTSIPPAQQVVSPPPMGESGYYLAQFAYQRDGTGDLLPIMRKSWWFDATSRNLGFILSTGPRLPEIFTLRDRRYSPQSPKN